VIGSIGHEGFGNGGPWLAVFCFVPLQGGGQFVIVPMREKAGRREEAVIRSEDVARDPALRTFQSCNRSPGIVVP
jgi:hypothetical protein